MRVEDFGAGLRGNEEGDDRDCVAEDEIRDCDDLLMKKGHDGMRGVNLRWRYLDEMIVHWTR